MIITHPNPTVKRQFFFEVGRPYFGKRLSKRYCRLEGKPTSEENVAASQKGAASVSQQLDPVEFVAKESNRLQQLAEILYVFVSWRLFSYTIAYLNIEKR